MSGRIWRLWFHASELGEKDRSSGASCAIECRHYGGRYGEGDAGDPPSWCLDLARYVGTLLFKAGQAGQAVELRALFASIQTWGRVVIAAAVAVAVTGCHLVLDPDRYTSSPDDWDGGTDAASLPDDSGILTSAFRRPLTIAAGSGTAVPAGYSVHFNLDTSLLVADGKARPDGADFRIVRDRGGGSFEEIPRWMDDAGPGFADGNTTTWFVLPQALSAGEVVEDYYVYYGDPQAQAPPYGIADVFLLGTDFETGLAPWEANARGETVAVQSATTIGGARALRVAPGSTLGGGVHMDLDLPLTGVLFSQHLRQAQTGSSFASVRTIDRLWTAHDRDDWFTAQVRGWVELDGSNTMVECPTLVHPGVGIEWFQSYGVDVWHLVEVFYDPSANIMDGRVDGGPFQGPWPDWSQSGDPVRSLIMAGEGQNGVFFVDNYTVRLFVDPEPTMSVGAEETL